MIGQDVINAALEGMTLVFETFSGKERKMPRLSLKTSDKNLIKVASLNGDKQHWCSYWIVPAIPEAGTILVPSGFRFRIDEKGTFLVTNEAGDHQIQLFERDYLVLISPSIREQIAETYDGEIRHWVSKGIFICNKPYFERQWQPVESDDKSIPALIAKGTLVDTESKDYQNMAGLRNALAEHAPSKAATHKPDPVWHPLENSVFDSEESAQSHPDFKDFDHIVINQKNPSNRHLNLMRMLLREKGRAIIDTLNPSKDDLSLIIKLLMERSYLIYRKGETGFSDLAWMKSLLRAEGYHVMTQEERLHLRDMNYESGYAKGLAEGRRQVSDSNVFATRAYQVGFDAGRMVERLGILKGEENDRTEREHAPESDSRGDRTFPEDGAVTSRLTSRHFEKLARHGANFRIGTEGLRESESRSRSATQWADSEQPIYADERLTSGEEVPETHGDSPAERNENEKGDA